MHAPRIDRQAGRWETRAITTVALVFFLGPAIAFAAGARGHPQENRAAVPFPGRAAGWHVFDSFGKYINDRMPLRKAAIRLDGWGDEHLFSEDRAFGGGSRPPVRLGRDGSMFLAEDIDRACEAAASPAATADGLRDAMAAISESGRDVVTMVAPNKTTIESSLLDPAPLGLDCYLTYTNQLWADLNAAHIPGWVDLRSAMSAAGPDPQTPRYLRTDSHWNRVGSIIAVHAAIDQFAPGLWLDSEVLDDGPQRYTGDLTLLRGTPSADTTASRIVDRPDVTLVATTSVSGAPVIGASHFVNSAPPGRLIPGKTLMLLDSFGNAAMPEIVPYFEDLTVVPFNSFEPDRYLSLIRDADRVWFLSVERHIADRVVTQWAMPKFLAQLRGLKG